MNRPIFIIISFLLILSWNLMAQMFENENSLKGHFKVIEVTKKADLGTLKITPYDKFFGEVDFEGVMDRKNDDTKCWGDYEMIWNVVSTELRCGKSIRKVDFSIDVNSESELKKLVIPATITTAQSKIQVILKRQK